MPTQLLVVAAVLAVVDAALRAWRPLPQALFTNAFFLAIAWVPFFVLPHVGTTLIAAWAASVGLLSLVDFVRMVGLSIHGRYSIPAIILTAACFPLAFVRGGSLLPVVPILALLVFVTMGAAGRAADGVLQKLCLAWLAVLVNGYLYAHAVLVAHAPRGMLSGPSTLALLILLAKFANVAWLAARRASGRTRIMLIAAPIGGALGGLAAPALWPAAAFPALPAVGLAIGLGLGAGCRAHTLIVADVTGEPEQQRKGTMLFGFGIALAVGYWALTLATSA